MTVIYNPACMEGRGHCHRPYGTGQQQLGSCDSQRGCRTIHYRKCTEFKGSSALLAHFLCQPQHYRVRSQYSSQALVVGQSIGTVSTGHNGLLSYYMYIVPTRLCLCSIVHVLVTCKLCHLCSCPTSSSIATSSPFLHT